MEAVIVSMFFSTKSKAVRGDQESGVIRVKISSCRKAVIPSSRDYGLGSA